jgi:hypothetical protein
MEASLADDMTLQCALMTYMALGYFRGVEIRASVPRCLQLFRYSIAETIIPRWSWTWKADARAGRFDIV